MDGYLMKSDLGGSEVEIEIERWFDKMGASMDRLGRTVAPLFSEIRGLALGWDGHSDQKPIVMEMVDEWLRVRGKEGLLHVLEDVMILLVASKETGELKKKLDVQAEDAKSILDAAAKKAARN